MSASRQNIDSLDVKTATSPHLWALELANILTVCERRGRIDAAKRKPMAEAVKDLGVVEQPHAQDAIFGEVMELAAMHSLSAYAAS
jgi:predicted nucleic acid-binding protein